jgi:hypothetical protein
LLRDRARLEGDGGVVGEAFTGLREPDRCDPADDVERSVDTGGVDRERDRRFFLPDIDFFSSGESEGARMLLSPNSLSGYQEKSSSYFWSARDAPPQT